MDYQKAIEYLYNLKIYGMSLGLERIEFLLKSIGSPHKNFNAIHVAGTNGKGSVCAMISSVLHKSGYKAGLFTSPHLVKFEERIQIDGIPISQNELVSLVEKIKPISESMVREHGFEHPTFFETACAMAFYHFYKEEVDYAVLEVGLGGRLDATNIITPLVSVITSVSLDHTHVLGNTLKEVAIEKAGIIKEGIPVIIGVEQKDILKLLEDISIKRNSPFYSTQKNGSFTILESNSDYQRFEVTVDDRTFSDLKINLAGDHQVRNAQIAVMTLDLLAKHNVAISDGNLKEGIEDTKWPGRLEIVQRDPTVIFDCAHNPHGMRALSRAMKRLFKTNKKTLVMGIMRDKDIPEIVKEACGFADYVIITKPKFERAAEIDVIAKEVEKYPVEFQIIPDVTQALDHAINNANQNDIICIAGSIFNVGEAMEALYGMT